MLTALSRCSGRDPPSSAPKRHDPTGAPWRCLDHCWHPPAPLAPPAAADGGEGGAALPALAAVAVPAVRRALGLTQHQLLLPCLSQALPVQAAGAQTGPRSAVAAPVTCSSSTPLVIHCRAMPPACLQQSSHNWYHHVCIDTNWYHHLQCGVHAANLKQPTSIAAAVAPTALRPAGVLVSTACACMRRCVSSASCCSRRRSAPTSARGWCNRTWQQQEKPTVMNLHGAACMFAGCD